MRAPARDRRMSIGGTGVRSDGDAMGSAVPVPTGVSAPLGGPGTRVSERSGAQPAWSDVMMHAPQRPSGIRFLENLAYLVPGYQGYRQRGLRREEDSRLRARVYRRVLQLIDEVREIEQAWQGSAAPQLLGELSARRQQLMVFSDGVRFSPAESCRFFLAEKLREPTLEQVLAADLLIFADLDELTDQLELGKRGSTAPRTLRAFLRVFDELLRRMEQHLIMRERALAGG
jgi:hypothetical protein